MRSAHRRFITKLLLFLLVIVGGAIINVAVAWFFAAVFPMESPVIGVRDTVNEQESRWWSKHAPRQATLAPDGITQSFNIGASLDVIYPFDEARTTVLARRTSAGLPFDGLGGSVWRTMGGTTVQKDSFELGKRVVPIRPLWPGFAINTIFYAAILWILFAFPGAVRRRLRRKRGQCASCGYSLRGRGSASANDMCPECGAEA